jgi:hypothetical protein
MNQTRPEDSAGQEGFVTQDGVSCPRKSPWNPKVSRATGLPFLPIILLAVFVLAPSSIPRLIFWCALLIFFAYPLRYLVCARCPYYGQPCSSSFGTIVPRMFRKQEGKSMKTGLWLDVVLFALLLLVPLPDMWRGGLLLTAVWLAAFFLFFAVLTKMACSVCPFTFCPIGQGGRAFWSAVDKR